MAKKSKTGKSGKPGGTPCTLPDVAELEAAIELWQDILIQDSNDPQGVRRLLAPALVESNRLREADELCAEFDDYPDTFLLYSQALSEFKQHGDNKIALEALLEAMTENPYVIEYLCGIRELPQSTSEMYTPGSAEEAHAYLAVAVRSWVATEGAVEWLSDFILRSVKAAQLAETFPGLPIAGAKENKVIDLKSLKHR